MKLYAVVNLKTKVRYGKKKKKPVDENRNKKAISMERKELLIFYLNKCCSSIYVYFYNIKRAIITWRNYYKGQNSALHDYVD